MPQLMQLHRPSSMRRSTSQAVRLHQILLIEPQLLLRHCRNRWVWVPDEKAGYLPGWIVKEEKSDPTQPLRSNKAKGDAQGDYLPIPVTRHGKEVSLEDASLVGDTVADVVLANGGDVRQSRGVSS